MSGNIVIANEAAMPTGAPTVYDAPSCTDECCDTWLGSESPLLPGSGMNVDSAAVSGWGLPIRMAASTGPSSMRSAPMATSRWPVYLFDGSSYETSVDISWDTPYGPFSVARSYRSNYDASSSSNVIQSMGPNWHLSGADMVVYKGSSEYILFVNGHSARIFESSGGGYISPDDGYMTLTVASGEVTVNNLLNGREWVFYDPGSTGIATELKGKLKWSTIRGGGTSSSNRITYTWLPSYFGALAGHLAYVVLPDNTKFSYSYNSNNLVSSIKVQPQGTGSNKIEAYYTYSSDFTFGAISGDVANTSDDALIQVKVRTRNTADTNWIDRYTQYRYERGYYLKAIYSSSSIQAIENDSLASSPENALTKPDSTVAAYASRAFTYYVDQYGVVEDVDTSGVDTIWEGGEDLEA
ncbi:MAG: hypothetical protein KDA87_23445, partial [Planctomycetales bacterium]|nr:hypothetical protein [Planctomycetales bacterium]